MARKRKTDADSAVPAAMMAFWKSGFHALGTRQLEDETGITRFSLQTSYGGKKHLFLIALDTYIDLLESHLLQQMHTGTLEGLARFFEHRPIPQDMTHMTCNGCLMVNSIVEFPRDDTSVNARAERFFDLLRGSFRSALKDLQTRQQIRCDLDPQVLAELLVSLTLSINLGNKSAAANTNLPAQTAAIGSLIRSWAI